MKKRGFPVPQSTPGDAPPIMSEVKSDLNVLVTSKTGDIFWNGKAVSLERLGILIGQTTAMNPQPELQFQPDPESQYALVDKVITVVKKAGAMKIGFVGNALGTAD